MKSCENKIGLKLCGNDAHATVFGVPMCASCISGEFKDEGIKEYVRKSRIGVVLAMKTLLTFAVRNIANHGTLKLPKLRLEKEYSGVLSRTARSRFKDGKVKEYEVHHREAGFIGKLRRDPIRQIWLVVTLQGVVDASGRCEVAAKILLENYKRGM